ncbi:MAG TPA: hotdog fold thioesterase [Cyclobacteriaceae bacterium]|nr:hotdog fold thioesterase [Cyclobacteriaceae bacterium]
MSIPEVKAAQLNQMVKGNMLEHLNIEFIESTSEYIAARMPVDHRTHQPFGLLHGGASVVLAETLGSVGANMLVNQQAQYCVGLEINANHIKAVRSGYVIGKARPLHVGSKTQVWEIRIENEVNELVCISRLTMAVIDKR